MATFMRRICFVLLMAGMFFESLSALSAEKITGRWKGSDRREYTFQKAGDGSYVMRVIGHPTRENMHFRGTFAKDGFEVSARLTSVSNIGRSIPLSVRRQVLQQHPDIHYR